MTFRAALPRRLPLLLGAALCLPLTACRYNFVPLIPPVQETKLPVRLTDVTLTRDGETLTLKAKVTGTFEPGYLGVRWYAGAQEIGQDSLFLDAAQSAATFTLAAPAKAAYRAVLTFGGVVLRQVELYEVAP